MQTNIPIDRDTACMDFLTIGIIMALSVFVCSFFPFSFDTSFVCVLYNALQIIHTTKYSYICLKGMNEWEITCIKCLNVYVTVIIVCISNVYIYECLFVCIKWL